MATSRQANPSREIFCPECGEKISAKAEICPECGVRVEGKTDNFESSSENKTRLGQKGYTIVGILSGLVSFLLLPIVFGPISIFSGIQLLRYHDERYGIGVIALGGSGLIIGMLIGAMMW